MRIIEKIAAAIEKADEEGTHPIEGPDWSLAMARAAVEAMMVPSEDIHPLDLDSDWQSNLRAILDEEE